MKIQNSIPNTATKQPLPKDFEELNKKESLFLSVGYTLKTPHVLVLETLHPLISTVKRR